MVNNPAKNGTFKPAILGTFVPALTVKALQMKHLRFSYVKQAGNCQIYFAKIGAVYKYISTNIQEDIMKSKFKIIFILAVIAAFSNCLYMGQNSDSTEELNIGAMPAFRN